MSRGYNPTPDLAQAWVDGVLVASVSGVAGRVNAVVDRNTTHIEPGPALCSFNVFPDGGNGNGKYLEGTIVLAGPAAPFVLPTVPSGQVLEYPTRRSLFNLSPVEVAQDGVGQALRDAGVNCLELQAFNNPANSTPWMTEAQWRQYTTPRAWAAIDWCKANGWDYIGRLDEAWVFPELRDFTHGGSFRETAFRETVQRLNASGRCRGVEMVDEANDQIATYAPQEVMGWWRAENGPPVTWPSHEWANWDASAFQDYSSRFNQIFEFSDWRERLPSLWQWHNWVKRETEFPCLTKPLGFIVSCAGPYYRKQVAGTEYNPAGDLIYGMGSRSETIIAQTWLSLAYGASRIRMYGYDFAHWREYRAGPIGTDYCQTGSRPGDARWPGVVAAYKGIEAREVALNDMPYTATVSGPWVFGRRGGLAWGVNTAERSLPSPNGAGTIIAPGGEAVGSTVPAGGVILWGA